MRGIDGAPQLILLLRSFPLLALCQSRSTARLAYDLFILVAEEERQLISVAGTDFASSAALRTFGLGKVALTCTLAVPQKSRVMVHERQLIKRPVAKEMGGKVRRGLTETCLTLIRRSRQLAQALLGNPLKAIVVPLTCVLMSCFRQRITAYEQMRQVHRELSRAYMRLMLVKRDGPPRN